PSLGTHAVNAAAAHHSKSKTWWVYKWLHGATAVLLTLPILAANLLMAGLLAIVLALNLLRRHYEWKETVLAAVAGTLSVAAAGWVLNCMLKSRKLSTAVWLVPLLLGTAVA